MNYLFLMQLEKPIIFQNLKIQNIAVNSILKQLTHSKKNGDLKSPLLS